MVIKQFLNKLKYNNNKKKFFKKIFENFDNLALSIPNEVDLNVDEEIKNFNIFSKYIYNLVTILIKNVGFNNIDLREFENSSKNLMNSHFSFDIRYHAAKNIKEIIEKNKDLIYNKLPEKIKEKILE